MTDHANKSSERGFSVKPLLDFGRKRAVELRRPDGRAVFSISVAWLAALGILALITHLFLPVALGAVALLLLKYEFVIKKFK